MGSLFAGRAQFAVGADAAGKEVVHQPCFDLPVFFNQRGGAFDGPVDGLQDMGDFLLNRLR